MMWPPRDSAMATKGKIQSRYSRKCMHDFDKKESDVAYDCRRIGNKSPMCKSLPTDGSISPVMRKKGIFNSYLKSKKLSDRKQKIEPPPTYSTIKKATKLEVIHHDADKANDKHWVDLIASGPSRPKSEVMGGVGSPEPVKEVEIIPKPDANYRVFALSSTSQAIKMEPAKSKNKSYPAQTIPNLESNLEYADLVLPTQTVASSKSKAFMDSSMPPQTSPISRSKTLFVDPPLASQTVPFSISKKVFVDPSLPRQTIAISRPHKSCMDLVQFRKHVDTLKQQQCWLVNRILKLKEELYLIINKMEEVTNANLKPPPVQRYGEVQEPPENTPFIPGNNCGCQSLFARPDSVDGSMRSDLALPILGSWEKFSIGDIRHSRDKICYDKCWNAKSSAGDEGDNEQQARLDRLLLSEDASVVGDSVSPFSNKTRHCVSRNTYYQPQYIFLAALMLLQFTIQFVTNIS